MDTAIPGMTKNAQTVRVLFLFAHIVSLLTLMLFPCICGHLDTIALPGSVLGFVLACCGFIKKKKATKWSIWLWATFLLIPTLVLRENIVDILWVGHGALLL
ncbi:MAG: hypothetical protein QGG42_17320 [Phycisphaerae bacterium]|jgi:hypothetical protein|nr:hypothetical protein [Phycisphaerae bacterium]